MKLTKIKIILALCSILALAGCFSPRYFSDKTVDVTDNLAWWGSLAPNQVVRLKSDVLRQGELLLIEPYVAHGKYDGEGVSVEKYKTSPEKWPSLKLVKERTRLRCLKLKLFYSFEYTSYKLDAEILDGNMAGQIVDIGSLTSGFAGNKDKGTLHPLAKYLEIVK